MTRFSLWRRPWFLLLAGMVVYGCLALLSSPVAGTVSTECSVPDVAFGALLANCQHTLQNQACYARGEISVTWREAAYAIEGWPGRFAEPGDRVPIAPLDRLEQAALAGLPTVSIINVGANLPPALPGPALWLAAYGDVALHNLGEASGYIPAAAACQGYNLVEANIRQTPSLSDSLVASLPRRTYVRILGQLPDRSWYQVVLPDGARGWIQADLLNPDCPFEAITPLNPAVPAGSADPEQQPVLGPMQDFELRSGGTAACGEAGLLIQTPGGVEAIFRVNGADIHLIGALWMQAIPYQTLHVISLTGPSWVSAHGRSQYLVPGSEVHLPLGGPEGLTVTSGPRPSRAASPRTLDLLPLDLLPQPIDDLPRLDLAPKTIDLHQCSMENTLPFYAFEGTPLTLSLTYTSHSPEALAELLSALAVEVLVDERPLVAPAGEQPLTLDQWRDYGGPGIFIASDAGAGTNARTSAEVNSQAAATFRLHLGTLSPGRHWLSFNERLSTGLILGSYDPDGPGPRGNIVAPADVTDAGCLLIIAENHH